MRASQLTTADSAQTDSMVPLGSFANLGARNLARLTHYGERTARRWIRDGLAPRVVVLCLQLMMDGDLGLISPAWDGWTLRTDGRVHSPEGPSFTPHEIRALPLWHQRMTTLEREVRILEDAARRASDYRQSDFAARVQQLAAMAATLAAEISQPSTDSLPRETPPERERGSANRRHDQTDDNALFDSRR